MTDANNCGGCGIQCNAGVACVNAQCAVPGNGSGQMCPPGYYSNGASCYGAPNNGSGDICAPGYYVSGSLCVEIPGNVGSNCPVGTYFNGLKCVVNPPTGSGPVCAPGYQPNGSNCIQTPTNTGGATCNAGYYYDPSTSSCVQTPGNTGTNCAAGTHFDGFKCVADLPAVNCPLGYYDAGGSCLASPGTSGPPKCAIGYYFNGYVCLEQPACQSPLVWNGNFCGYPTCDPGFHFDGQRCVIDVPANESPTNGSGNMSIAYFPIDSPSEERDAAAPDLTIAGGAIALFWALNRRRDADG
jgi:hypothetical protein